MNTDLSLLTLIFEASLVVQLVMLALLSISLYSWTLIFNKRSELAQARRSADEFENEFWSSKELSSLYRTVHPRPDNQGMASMFAIGFKEFMQLKKLSSQPSSVLQGVQRVMRVSLAREIDQLETSLSFLATAGSASPYIGLFGTVWGIMNSFRALGDAQQATLAMVAPGIAEALIATAMGLFAAIPAVIAYNRYAYQIERLINRYDSFLEEFSSILQRQHN